MNWSGRRQHHHFTSNAVRQPTNLLGGRRPSRNVFLGSVCFQLKNDRVSRLMWGRATMGRQSHLKVEPVQRAARLKRLLRQIDFQIVSLQLAQLVERFF